MFAIIEIYFNSLTHQVPGHGHYPKPSKKVLIVYLDHPEARKLFGARHGFKVCSDARYIGFYVGDDESKFDCPRENKETWENSICAISKTAGKYS